MSRIEEAYQQIHEEWRILQSRWLETSEVWQDHVHGRFERDFWEEVARVMPATLRSLEQLGEIISRAGREIR